MDTPNITATIIGTCSGLALLAPLVKVVGQWHIALRKTSIHKKPSEIAQQASSNATQRSSIFGRWSMLFEIVVYVFAMSNLLYLSSPWANARPATSHDVAFVGLLVALLLQNMVARKNT